MTISSIDESQRKAARVTGFAFVVAMAIAIFGEFYVLAGLIVPGNAADTARNILAHETRFRISIASDLIYVATLVALLSALYVILKPVNRGLAINNRPRIGAGDLVLRQRFERSRFLSGPRGAFV